MSKLFQTRLQAHFSMLFKYWKLVFNDHFVIALFFMFGALAYGYSQALDKIKSPVWWGKPLALVVLLLIVQLGRLATLVEKPDPVFLLPKTKQINRYLNQARNYSLLMAELITIACFAVLSPFLAVGVGMNTTSIILLGISMIGLKLIWMNWSVVALFDRKWQRSAYDFNAKWLDPALLIVIGLYLSAAITVVITIIVGLSSFYLISNTQKSNVLDWRTAVDQEATRMQRIYRFFNMFTDVPSVQGTIHRRRYLDWIIKLLGNQKTTYGYLFSRGLVRGADISGLIARLTIVGMLIVFFIPQGWLNVIVFGLFIYLVSVQLISLYGQFDNSVFVHIYPVTETEKQTEFRLIATKVLVVVTVCLLVGSITQKPDWMMMGIKFVLGVVEVGVLSTVYLKGRIQSKA